MPLYTSVIGAYPKPDYFKIPSFFDNPKYIATDHRQFFSNFNQEGPMTTSTATTMTTWITTPQGQYCKEAMVPVLVGQVGIVCTLDAEGLRDHYEALVDKAVKETLKEQTSLGIDVVTDGEIRRGNYINHLCRHLEGFDFENLTTKSCRNGAWVAEVPTIRGKMRIPDEMDWIADEWRSAQNNCDKPVKVTVPGPMTIIGSTANVFYDDVKELSSDLVKVVNAHIKHLVKAGCRHIQLDEPVMVRDPDVALDYGIDHASQCFDGVGTDVTKTVHLCCGYPLYLDQTDYPKADKDAYFVLADKLDQAGFDEISLEDAHRRNDLSLFDHFKKTKVILGSVAVARSRVETVEEIRSRLRDVLKHLPAADHLIVAPDCGLGFLPNDVLRAKLTNMVEAAQSLP